MLDRMLPSGSLSQNKNRFRSRRLGAAAGMLGAAGASGSADAGIHYDLAANAGPGDSISLLLPIDADYDTSRIDLFLTGSGMNLDFGVGPNGNSPLSTLQLVGQAGLGMGMGGMEGMAEMGSMAYHALSELAPGTTVDGSLNSASLEGNNGIGYLVRQEVGAQGWSNGASGYAGFEFSYNGAPVYGWLKIDFSGSSFTLEQWGYDNTGAPIEVGAIPEPNTALLLGLGLAGLAMAGRKARKLLTESTNGVSP
ncbi:MAG: PEP-CTERM sorting domain-containing protein [Myxococcota bacterium]|nr:PEP-CTERM sorting domain-containing protein [Myxococcota bacterium]